MSSDDHPEEGSAGVKRSRPTPISDDTKNPQRMARLQAFLPLVLSTATNDLPAYWNAVFEKELCTVECVLAAEGAQIDALTLDDPAPPTTADNNPNTSNGEGDKGSGSIGQAYLEGEKKDTGSTPANARLQRLLEDLHVWFGMEAVMVSLFAFERIEDITKTSRILDVGCGNGYFCEALRAMGYSSVTGIDTSEAAIQLATILRPYHEAACVENGVDLPADSGICFEQANINDDTPIATGPYDIVFDKGTLDAIGMERPLSPPDPNAPPLAIDTVSQPAVDYAKAVRRSVRRGGYIITLACAFDKDEIKVLYPDCSIVEDLSSYFQDGLFACILKVP